MNWIDTYKNAVICNVRQGKNSRADIIYAEIRDVLTNEILVSATLDYCVERMKTVAKAVQEGGSNHDTQ